MNIWKEIKSKTWIDWVKVLVAIDIAGVGIGLILGFNMHVLAHIFGVVSHIIFGVLYLCVAVLIFRRIFPETSPSRDGLISVDDVSPNPEISANPGKKTGERILKQVENITDRTHEKIDYILDKGEDFLDKRKHEIREEFQRMTKE